MADYEVNDDEVAAHATLSAGDEDVITFERPVPSAEVINRSAAGTLFFTVDGSEATVEGANCFPVPAGQSRSARLRGQGSTGREVHVISDTADEYSVVRGY